MQFEKEFQQNFGDLIRPLMSNPKSMVVESGGSPLLAAAAAPPPAGAAISESLEIQLDDGNPT